MTASRRELILRAIAARYETAVVSFSGTAEEVVSEYPISEWDGSQAGPVGFSHRGRGVAFEWPENRLLVGASFHLQKAGSPTGTAHVRIYATSGAFGSAAKPTGSPLASIAFDVADLPSAYEWVRFDLGSPLELDAGYYAAVIEFDNIDTSNFLRSAIDLPGTHPGNGMASIDLVTWTVDPSVDVIHEVHGVEAIAKPSGLSVHRHHTRQTQAPDAPELIVYYAGERPDAAATDEADRHMLVRARCRVVAPDGVSGDEALDELLTWAEVALLSDYKLGGLVAEISLPEIDAITAREYADTWAEATLQFEVTHQTKWGDPRSLP